MSVTDFTRVSQSVKTNSNGTAHFTNVPAATVSIFTHPQLIIKLVEKVLNQHQMP